MSPSAIAFFNYISSRYVFSRRAFAFRERLLEWIPERLARLTVDQYEAMVESGVFTKRDRLTLVNGVLVTKLTKNRPHVIATEETRRNLERTVPPGWHVMSEAPVCLPPDSVP